MLVFGDFQLNGTQPDIDDGFLKVSLEFRQQKK